jgi:hypothetical protein
MSRTAFRPLHVIRASQDIAQIALLGRTRSDAGRRLADPARALRAVEEHLHVAHPITARPPFALFRNGSGKCDWSTHQ